MALSETAYCTEEQIESRIGYVLTTSTKPTLVQASDFANLRYNDINAALLAAGVSTPIDATANPIAYECLARVNALLAAADCLDSWTSPDADVFDPRAEQYRTMGKEAIALYSKWPSLLGDSSRTTQGSSCYQTKNPSGRDLDNELGSGDDTVRPFQITDGEKRW